MTEHESGVAGLSRRTLFKGAGVAGAAVAVGGAPAAHALDLPGAGASAGAGSGAGAVLQLARVWATTRAEKVLRGEFDDTHVVFEDGSIEVLLWPGDLPRLVASGLRHQVTVPDLVARDASLRATASGRPAGLPPQPGEREDYRMPDDFLADMRDLEKRFPTMARVLELPHKTLEGRTVHAIEIATDVTRRDGRAVFYLDGIHHSREWPAAEFPIMFAFDLLEGYAADPRIANLVDNVRTVIVPVMNLDGYVFSRTALVDVSGVGGPSPVGNAYWRKNRRHEEADRANSHGVDCNRNYAYAWGDDIGGSSSSKSSSTYRGVAPMSEPETQNAAGLMQRFLPTAMITNHTSGNLVLWAWGDTEDDAPDNDLLEGLGRACATFNGYKPQKSIDLYETTGTCSDYAYGSLGAIGYTFEHAGSSFHPDYTSTIPAQYDRNRDAFFLLMEEMCLRPEDRPAGRSLPPVLAEFGYDPDALHHSVLTGRIVDGAGKGVSGGTVRLQKQFETLLWRQGNGKNPLGRVSVPETLDAVIEVGDDGRFVWNLPPSTRPYLEFQGKTETYTLTAKAGDSGVVREVVLARGQVLDLGTIVVR